MMILDSKMTKIRRKKSQKSQKKQRRIKLGLDPDECQVLLCQPV